MNEDQKQFIARAVERAKREILDDIAYGRVQFTVKSFGDLHDYVDANEYGGLCEDAFAEEGNRLFPERDDPDTIHTQELMGACNLIQFELNSWLQCCAADIDAATNAALDAGAALIQQRHDVDTGDFAGLWFPGEQTDKARELFARYFWAQLHDKATTD